MRTFDHLLNLFCAKFLQYVWACENFVHNLHCLFKNRNFTQPPRSHRSRQIWCVGKTDKYDGKNKQIWWEKLTGSCHVCKLQPPVWCDAGSVSLRTFEQSNWTEYRGLAWITNQHVQRISFVQSSHFMTLGLDTLGWGSQLLSASFPPRQPRYIRQFRIRRNEGGKFDARRDWRISWVKSALSSPWDLGSRSFLVSTTPFSSSSGPPLLRRSKEGMRPSALEFYWRGSTLVYNQETVGTLQ